MNQAKYSEGLDLILMEIDVDLIVSFTSYTSPKYTVRAVVQSHGEHSDFAHCSHHDKVLSACRACAKDRSLAKIIVN